MRLKTQKKQIIREIKDVWKREPYSKHVRDVLEHQDDDLEYNDVKQIFLGKNWWEVPDEVFEYGYASPFFLSGAPLRYFLPAFMLYAIKDSWVMDRLLDNYFYPPKNESFESFIQKFSDYSSEEKQAILHFLIYAKSYYLHKGEIEVNRRSIKRIDDAIERYWCPCPRVLKRSEDD